MFAYIHLNPVKLIDTTWKETGIRDKERARTYLMNYQYSSFLDYASGENFDREAVQILTKIEFPEYFLDKRDFGEFIKDWMTHE